MTCPLCAGDGSALFQARGYDVHSCLSCGHRFAGGLASPDHVTRVYGDSYFSGGGAGYDDYTRSGPILVERGRYYARELLSYCEPGRLLDVGAASGHVLEGFLMEGWEGHGIEPNQRMCAIANARLGDVVHQGSLETWQGRGAYDLVSMIQVVAHFQDPHLALRVAAGLTRPGGFWLFETWDRSSWTAKAFGRHWHEYSPPSVLHWFSKASLTHLVSEMGFRLIATGRPRKWIDVGHAFSLLRHSVGLGGSGPAATKGFTLERMRLPYPGDDVFWALFQDAR